MNLSEIDLSDGARNIHILGAGTNLTGAGTTGDPYIMAITLPNDDTTYSMMTSSTLGLGKLEDDTTQTVAANSVTATASRTYGIQSKSSNQLRLIYVNISLKEYRIS